MFLKTQKAVYKIAFSAKFTWQQHGDDGLY